MTSATAREPLRLEEPKAVDAYSRVLTDVAAGHPSVIVQRNGTDLAAVISLDHLTVLREALLMQEAERLSARIDWDAVVATRKPPQAWYDDDDNPFEPESTP